MRVHYIEADGSSGPVGLSNDRQKLRFMRDYIDEAARHPAIVELGSRLVRPFDADAWHRQAKEIHRFVRDGVRYQRDPDRKEQLAHPVAALARGFGDCDDKVALSVALARAVGLEADVWPVWKGDMLDHVQTAMRWPGSAKLDASKSGAKLVDGPPGSGWVIGDMTIRTAELGQDPHTVTKNAETGRPPLV